MYALLILGIFALLLNFYLSRTVARGRQLVAIREATQAQMMAELTQTAYLSEYKSGDNVHKPVEKLDKKEVTTKPFSPDLDKTIHKKQKNVDNSEETVDKPVKTYGFTQGQAQVQQRGSRLWVKVKMTQTGRLYSFQYRLKSD